MRDIYVKSSIPKLGIAGCRIDVDDIDVKDKLLDFNKIVYVDANEFHLNGEVMDFNLNEDNYHMKEEIEVTEIKKLVERGCILTERAKHEIALLENIINAKENIGLLEMQYKQNLKNLNDALDSVKVTESHNRYSVKKWCPLGVNVVDCKGCMYYENGECIK